MKAADKGNNVKTMIDVYVRTWADEPELGSHLGALPLSECEPFAAYFVSTNPWYGDTAYGTGGGHFIEVMGSWRFEIVLDKEA